MSENPIKNHWEIPQRNSLSKETRKAPLPNRASVFTLSNQLKTKMLFKEFVIFRSFGQGKMWVQVGYDKKRLVSYQPPTANPVFPKNKFRNSH